MSRYYRNDIVLELAHWYKPAIWTTAAVLEKRIRTGELNSAVVWILIFCIVNCDFVNKWEHPSDGSQTFFTVVAGSQFRWKRGVKIHGGWLFSAGYRTETCRSSSFQIRLEAIANARTWRLEVIHFKTEKWLRLILFQRRKTTHTENLLRFQWR